MKIYISGKMRGLPEEESRKKFEAAQQYLIELGHDVVNPWAFEKEKEEQCSEWSDYIMYDLRIIKGCNALYMLNNWRESNGAKCEHAFACGRGMEIIYETPELETANLSAVSEKYADERLSIIRPDISDSSYSRKTKMTLDLFEGYELESAFEEGANWQREQIAQHNMLLPFREYDNLLESVNRRKKEGYEAGFKQGAIDAKEELLKEAVDAEVSMRIMSNSKAYVSFDTFYTDLCYNEGEKVKLVVIKEANV